MPRLYSKYLNTALEEVVGQVMGEDPREALNLFEELALMRISAGEAIKLYGAALKIGDEQKGQELRMSAAAVMAQALGNVQSMCEAAARVESQGKDKFSVHTLRAIIDQITLVAHATFKDHPDLVMKFQRDIKEQVRIPAAGGAEGTHLTPDKDVMGMDATIPSS